MPFEQEINAFYQTNKFVFYAKSLFQKKHKSQSPLNFKV